MSEDDDVPGHQRVLEPTAPYGAFIVHDRAPPDHLNHAKRSAIDHLLTALEFLPEGRRRVAVQAGGHIGMWPLFLSNHFEVVYTFEPDADNFRCLAHNAPFWNIYPFRAALGRDPGWCDLRFPPRSGGNQVKVLHEGRTPVMTVDQLCLEDLDLLALDVEGYETAVYIGAEDTIARCKPVIICEETGKVAADGSGFSVKTAHQWLQLKGYERRAQVNKDGIWVKD